MTLSFQLGSQGVCGLLQDLNCVRRHNVLHLGWDRLHRRLSCLVIRRVPVINQAERELEKTSWCYGPCSLIPLLHDACRADTYFVLTHDCNDNKQFSSVQSLDPLGRRGDWKRQRAKSCFKTQSRNEPRTKPGIGRLTPCQSRRSYRGEIIFY